MVIVESEKRKSEKVVIPENPATSTNPDPQEMILTPTLEKSVIQTKINFSPIPRQVLNLKRMATDSETADTRRPSTPLKKARYHPEMKTRPKVPELNVIASNDESENAASASENISPVENEKIVEKQKAPMKQTAINFPVKKNVTHRTAKNSKVQSQQVTGTVQKIVKAREITKSSIVSDSDSKSAQPEVQSKLAETNIEESESVIEVSSRNTVIEDLSRQQNQVDIAHPQVPQDELFEVERQELQQDEPVEVEQQVQQVQNRVEIAHQQVSQDEFQVEVVSQDPPHDEDVEIKQQEVRQHQPDEIEKEQQEQEQPKSQQDSVMKKKAKKRTANTSTAETANKKNKRIIEDSNTAEDIQDESEESDANEQEQRYKFRERKPYSVKSFIFNESVADNYALEFVATDSNNDGSGAKLRRLLRENNINPNSLKIEPQAGFIDQLVPDKVKLKMAKAMIKKSAKPKKPVKLKSFVKPSTPARAKPQQDVDEQMEVDMGEVSVHDINHNSKIYTLHPGQSIKLETKFQSQLVVYTGALNLKSEGENFAKEIRKGEHNNLKEGSKFEATNVTKMEMVFAISQP